MPKKDKKQSPADTQQDVEVKKNDAALDSKEESKSTDSTATETTNQKQEQEQEQTQAKSDSQDQATSNASASVSKEVAEDDQPYNEPFSAKVLVVTSGKGGVGKTTSAASISTGLARRGFKTAVIDFDIGLRNLDLIMGVERRVIYDMINVLNQEATLNQALIKDKNCENLYILAASQTKDKDALTYAGVGRILKELSDLGFEYIVCDSPAGIEKGALMALYYADEAIVTANPEVSSVRDSDRIIGILDAKSRRATLGLDPIQPRLLLTRYSPSRVEKEEMLSVGDVHTFLSIPLLGVIPESQDVLTASNKGVPIIALNPKSVVAQAYEDTVERLLGKNDLPIRFIEVEKKGFWAKLFSK